MTKDWHEDLLATTERLRALVASCSTEQLVGRYCLYNLARVKPKDRQRDFDSPGRQWPFVLDLMLATPEPDSPSVVDDQVLEEIQELANTIFGAYLKRYFIDLPSRDDEDAVKEVIVSSAVFVDYFNQGLLATIQQVEGRIERYILPFDESIEAELGIGPARVLEIVGWLRAQLQASVNAFQEATIALGEARNSTISEAKKAGKTVEEVMSDPGRAEEFVPLASAFADAGQRVMKVARTDLETQFGADVARAYWETFAVGRGTVPRVKYPTDPGTALDRGLFEIEPGIALCPVANALSVSALRVFERHLLDSSAKDAFLARRGRALEDEAEQQLRRLLGPTADYYPAVFENEYCQFEHDSVAKLGRTVVVAEAKSSPPREPLRDPDRAYPRIKDDFRGSSGIQGAFEQARRIWRKWNEGGMVELFDDAGAVVLEFDRTTVDAVYLVCVTRDSFGPLATNLSHLLQKEDHEPYPWAVNILDLEQLADAWEYFGWDGERFVSWLDERRKLHGRVGATDELDIAGFSIKHGSLRGLPGSTMKFVQLVPTYSNVFDEIYLAKMGGGAPVVYAPTQPVAIQFARPGSQVPRRIQKASRKQRRNDPCGCGSGRKFKRCCGKSP